MKIEKITENKIRITLKREEFKDKKIDINELLLTSADSQKLFLEILKKLINMMNNMKELSNMKQMSLMY